MSRATRDLTDLEAAAALGKHKRTIQRWAQSGRLPGAYRAGRSWRIPESAIRRAGLPLATDGQRLISEIVAASDALDRAQVGTFSDSERVLLGRHLEALVRKGRAVGRELARRP